MYGVCMHVYVWYVSACTCMYDICLYGMCGHAHICIMCMYSMCVHVHVWSVCMCIHVYLWHVCMHIYLWCAHVWGHMPAYGGQRTLCLRQDIFVISQCTYSAKIAGSQASRERSFHRNTRITELQYAQFCVGSGDSDSDLHGCSARTVPSRAISPVSLLSFKIHILQVLPSNLSIT